MELDNYIEKLAEILLRTDDDAARVWQRVAQTAETACADTAPSSDSHSTTDFSSASTDSSRTPGLGSLSALGSEPPPLAPLSRPPGKPAAPGSKTTSETPGSAPAVKGGQPKPPPPRLPGSTRRPKKGPKIRPAPPRLVNLARRSTAADQRGFHGPPTGPPTGPAVPEDLIPVITLDGPTSTPPTTTAPSMPALNNDEPEVMPVVWAGPSIRASEPFNGKVRVVRVPPTPQAEVLSIKQPPMQGPAMPPLVPILLPTGELWHVPYFAVKVSRKYRLRTLEGRWSLRFNRQGQLRYANRIG
ncbi:nascent polypeptide-associated complex subunit alpha, muscle-specific form-like [Harpegnathos saltator]|uniref:nascent polypeptide-associated complex subunit alpha, muscle-specific form-like n=1 Tax=Harpegnathos saltator TaxID=610380 RepID=UPI000DBEE665|nr:nascent polypeptide-associated complex subunit alpha, muscle-specific form-like [Harpegnathos saltator]